MSTADGRPSRRRASRIRRALPAPARAATPGGSAAALIAVLAAAIAIAGCGASAGSAASAGQVVSMVVQGGSVVGETEVDNAELLLTGRCMRARGFKWEYPPEPPLPGFLRGGASVLRDGEQIARVPAEAAVVRQAEESGFGISAFRAHPPGSPGNPLHPAKLIRYSASRPIPKPTPRQRAYQVALNGPHGQNGTFTVAGIAQHKYTTAGCGAQASARLYGSRLLAVEAGYLPEDLGLVVSHDLRTDPVYIADTRRWARCLEAATSRHLSAAEPYNVSNELLGAESARTGPMSASELAFERRVALADVRCQYSTGLIAATVALDRRFAAHLAGPYEGLLLTIVEARARARRRARQILAAAGR